MASTISLLNIDQPAPRWYRKAKRIVGLLSGPSFLAIFQIFHLSDHAMASVGLIISFLPTVIEIFNAVLSNGQEYAPTGTKQALADVTGVTVKDESGNAKPQ